MKLFRRCQRILILSLLSLSVFAPIVLVSHRLKYISSIGRKEFIEDLSNIKYRTDELRLEAIQQEASEDLKEPRLVVYEDKDLISVISHDSEKSKNAGDTTNALENSRNGTTHENKAADGQYQQRGVSYKSAEKEQFSQTVKKGQNILSTSNTVPDEKIKETKEVQYNHTVQTDPNVRSQSRKVMDENVKQMKDQVIRAKVYLKFASPGNNSQLVKELKLRIKELERVVGDATKDSDLSKSALQKMRYMESSLSKASQVFPDCSPMAAKLRAMTGSAEEQVQSQKKQASYLLHLAAGTTPKGLHCLSMRLTAEYFALEPEQRQLPNQQSLHDSELYHYVVFSDNILACAVVVNSTVSNAAEPEKIVLHVVTDSLNFPAISMWFLVNPPGKAKIQIQSTDSFEWLPTKYKNALMQNSSDPRYTSELNHLRFYLPNIFPKLSKIVLFDHDVVVQRDLTGLWKVNMKGKVNGAVGTCQRNEPSFRQMDTYINFSEPLVAKKFDVKTCTWAFGLNLFDLREWRRRNLTARYQKYLELGFRKPLWVAGTLPLGWLTFYNHTMNINTRWHILGLGYESGVARGNIERAAVIHYDGLMKPWLDIVIGKYKGYWSKYVNYDHPYLQQCNIHD
ncbi:probable galacturonosyltransferase 6 [Ziziphus jujuba]|uniref:Hexosyltransferase n=1 Tax=Ziziphus jujuba TaxID=326968 RepID=A0A6P6FSC1_ZIZJJ|nr:probable galacturonosyltransferase 6 [Ziziphus jujuba]